MTTDAARKAVSETPELLEHIISFLPAKVIFAKVQRLSRAWKAAVESSPAIQTKLWLQPKERTVIQPASFSDGPVFSHPGSWDTGTFPTYSHNVAVNTLAFQGMLMNTVTLETHGMYPSFGILFDRGYSPKRALTVQLCAVADIKARAGQPAISASYTWREMYLTDPPITTASLDVLYRYKHGLGYNVMKVPSVIRDHSGITLGLFYDMCLASVPLDIEETLVSEKEFRFGSIGAIFY